jgi:inhibitor of cysteine peptidase
MKGLSILLGLILGAALSGCSRQPENPKQVDAMKAFVKTDSGTTCELEVGENFEIRLPENPTTGYTWAAVKIPEGLLRPESESFEAETADPRIVGRGGTKVMVFKALKAGSGELELRLRRPWEKDAFIDSFVLKITIKGNQ